MADRTQPNLTFTMPWHWLLLAVMLAFVVTNMFSQILTQQNATALFALAIVIAGIPHGTLDIEIIAQKLGSNGFAAKVKYTTAYVACAAVMVGLWYVFSGLALVTFLMLSVVHFGRDWRLENEPFLGFMVGGALIAVPALSHNAEVASIFEILVGSQGGKAIADGLACSAIPPLLASLVFCIVAFQQKNYAVLVNVVSCLIAAIALPPLASFAIFFCGLHSPRHFKDALQEAGNITPWNKAAVVFAVTALSFGLGAGIFAQGTGLSFDEGIIRTVFILISILTLPHFLLEQFLPRFERSPV